MVLAVLVSLPLRQEMKQRLLVTLFGLVVAVHKTRVLVAVMVIAVTAIGHLVAAVALLGMAVSGSAVVAAALVVLV